MEVQVFLALQAQAVLQVVQDQMVLQVTQVIQVSQVHQVQADLQDQLVLLGYLNPPA